jgi:hypothetical protein
VPAVNVLPVPASAAMTSTPLHDVVTPRIGGFEAVRRTRGSAIV